MSVPRLDIVLPARDVAPWIAECLASLQSQSLADWRAHVILDRCTDRTEDIAAQFAARDSRFLVHHSPSPGVGAARNWGLRQGSARYVAFADADDVVPPGAYEALVTSLESTGSVVATGAAIDSGSGQPDRPYWSMASGLHDEDRPAVGLGSEPRLVLDHTIWNKVYSREFLQSASILFDQAATLAEDSHHSARVVTSAAAVDVLSAVVYRHRRRDNSLTATLGSDESLASWVRMTRESLTTLTSRAPREAVTLYARRMLEDEAFTRIRLLHRVESDEHALAVRDLCALVATTLGADGVAQLPLLQRWALEAIGAVRVDPSGSLAEAVQHCDRELDVVDVGAQLATIAAFQHTSGVSLRLRAWREGLLLPTLRMLAHADALGRTIAIARAVAFQRRFVSEASVPAADRELLAMLQQDSLGPALAAIAARAQASPRSSGLRARAGSLRLDVVDTKDGDRVVAESIGVIAGLRRPIPSRRVAERAVTVRLRADDLRPFGRWALELQPGTWVERAVAITRGGETAGRPSPRLRRIWVVGRLGDDLIVETRARLMNRLRERVLGRLRGR